MNTDTDKNVTKAENVMPSRKRKLEDDGNDMDDEYDEYDEVKRNLEPVFAKVGAELVKDSGDFEEEYYEYVDYIVKFQNIYDDIIIYKKEEKNDIDISEFLKKN